MSITHTRIREFEKEYLQTSGIAVNLYYSKIRKEWVAYCFGEKFSDVELHFLLDKLTNYIKANRIETGKVNYQFKYKVEK